MKAYIGIDPGGKGFCTVLKDGVPVEFFPLQGSDPHELAEFLRKHEDCTCIMEEVHAVFGSSAKGTFAFGEIFGLLKGLIVASGLPYHLVQPKEWQSEIWINEDKIYRYKGDGKKMVDTKGTSIRAAKRLFPSVDLRRTPTCRKVDDNKVDSMLIAEYGRRRNL